MKVTWPHIFVSLILALLNPASASIRGATRKIQRLLSSFHVFEGLHPKKSLVVTNKCRSPVKSILRFYDGTLKQIVTETMSHQDVVSMLTDNTVTVALVAGVHIDSNTDVYSRGCFSNDAKYVVKDGLCYKYHFFNASSLYHQVDITCD
jgi:hypothetical protein